MVEQKRRGRPPKSAEDRKGGNLTFRVRSGMREKLETSAKARQLSISEEIEQRLEQSFQTASDPRKDIALRLVADNWRAIEEVMGANMFDDVQVNLACAQAASTAVTALGGLLMGATPNLELARELVRLDAEAFGMASALMMVHIKGKIDDPETKAKLREIMIEIQARRLESVK